MGFLRICTRCGAGNDGEMCLACGGPTEGYRGGYFYRRVKGNQVQLVYRPPRLPPRYLRDERKLPSLPLGARVTITGHWEYAQVGQQGVIKARVMRRRTFAEHILDQYWVTIPNTPRAVLVARGGLLVHEG